MLRGSILLLSLIAPACGFAAPESPGRVGVAAAVSAVAEGWLHVDEVRSLEVGHDIWQGERVETNDAGLAQLLFIDGSTVTVGNRASLVVDDFVYDVSAQHGHLGIAMSKGVFRFVGGRLSKDGSVTVRTPTALLGIRGAIVLIEVSPEDGATTVTMLYGDHVQITTPSGGSQMIRRAGFSSSVAHDGAPSAPRRIEAGRLHDLEGLLTRSPGTAARKQATLPAKPAVARSESGATLTAAQPVAIGVTEVAIIGQAAIVLESAVTESAVTLGKSSTDTATLSAVAGTLIETPLLSQAVGASAVATDSSFVVFKPVATGQVTIGGTVLLPVSQTSTAGRTTTGSSPQATGTSAVKP